MPSLTDLIQPMIDDLKARGIAEQSEGALVVRVAAPDDKHDIPPLILTKSDGGVMYGTTDLGTIVDRVRSHDPDLTLYVVDQRQHLHFEQVFRAASRAGLNGRMRMEHLGFGTMNGPDGKPFKTRAGGVMKLQDLIVMATVEATKRLNEAGLAVDYPTTEHRRIAGQVAIAALKFADLANHRTSNYIFDLERSRASRARRGPTCNMPPCASNHCCATRQSRATRPAASCLPRASSGRWPCCWGDCPMP
jgi:arginyl-tRNA synthetase